MRSVVAVLAFVVCCAASFVQGFAGEKPACGLVRNATFDMTISPDGRILIPVEISGKQLWFLFDTGAPATIISPDTAESLNLVTRPLQDGVFTNSSGQSFKFSALIDHMKIGQMKAAGVRVLVYPQNMNPERGYNGLFGADFLSNYDVELDFKAAKIHLYSPDHCPGQVISWPATAVAVIPLSIGQWGHITLPLELEGKPMRALLDTGASHTFLDDDVAKGVFGLTLGDAQTPAVETDGDRTVYEHRFKSLMLDGIGMGNVPVLINHNESKARQLRSPKLGTRIGSASDVDGLEQIILGMKQLMRLHLYISYKERRLYATAP